MAECDGRISMDDAQAAITAWTASRVAGAPGVVERLNMDAVEYDPTGWTAATCQLVREAADTILALTAERESLRAHIQAQVDYHDHEESKADAMGYDASALYHRQQARLHRAALQPKEQSNG